MEEAPSYKTLPHKKTQRISNIMKSEAKKINKKPEFFEENYGIYYKKPESTVQ